MTLKNDQQEQIESVLAVLALAPRAEDKIGHGEMEKPGE
jgi:hypothetical protein